MTLVGDEQSPPYVSWTDIRDQVWMTCASTWNIIDIVYIPFDEV